MIKEKGTHKTLWRIIRFNKGGSVPYSVSVIEDNCFLNVGINNLWGLIAGDGEATPYDHDNARLGVGNSETEASATQEGLLGGSTAYKGMDTSFPTYGTDQKIVFQATFGLTEANFAWKEFTVDNGTISINRKVSSQGEKLSSQIWILQLEITIS